MKKKEFKKKLSLNKQSIANLDQNEMKYILGGDAVPSGDVCNTKSVRMRCCPDESNDCITATGCTISVYWLCYTNFTC